MRPMTRARITAKGLVTPPPLHRLMEAVLLLCVSLVQGVATTFGMRFKRQAGVWHIDQTQEALPQTKPDTSLQGPTTPHTVILGLILRISVGPTQGPTNIPCEAPDQGARHKPQHRTLGSRIPREGGGPVLRAAQTHTYRSALRRADQTLALIPNCRRTRMRELRD
jgi:hypothetical protein